jgi:hypothetical protein
LDSDYGPSGTAPHHDVLRQLSFKLNRALPATALSHLEQAERDRHSEQNLLETRRISPIAGPDSLGSTRSGGSVLLQVPGLQDASFKTKRRTSQGGLISPVEIAKLETLPDRDQYQERRDMSPNRRHDSPGLTPRLQSPRNRGSSRRLVAPSEYQSAMPTAYEVRCALQCASTTDY